MKNYDFIAIGDIVTDAFIKIKEATVEDGDDGRTKICMNFGDKIPYEDVYIIPAVGNSPNASVSAARLGLKSALVTNLGNDYYGKECLDVLKEEKVGTEFVKIQKNKQTNYHYVLLFREERTILIKHEDFEYSLPKIGNPKWIYLSSAGPNSLPFHSAIEKYLDEHPEINLAFQPGTYQIKFGTKVLAGIYKRAHLFFCNRDEARRILGAKDDDIKKLLGGIHNLGPKIVAITDGKFGAYLYDGDKMWFMPLYPDPKPPVNRTGAGDAFSSTFVVATLLGKSTEEALRWGPVNSMSVTQNMGARAGLLSRKKLEELLSEAPADYKPRLI
jgi:2-dehydro-3-deoxygluconokinase